MAGTRRPTPSDLRDAVMIGDIHKVRGILEMHIPQEANSFGNTPLHIAAFYSQYQIVEVLLEHGADRSLENENKNTPIQMALYKISEDSFKTVEKFAKYPTDKDDSYSYGAGLIFLVEHKRYQEAIALLEAGANPNGYGFMQDDSSALHLAIEDDKSNESLQFIQLLLEKGARRTALKKIGHQSYLPIELAAYNYRFDALKLFAKLPANVDDDLLYDFAPYKLLIVESCIEELKAYEAKLYKLHGKRAKNLLEHLEPIYSLLNEKMKVDIQEFLDKLILAKKAFIVNKQETIDQTLPYFALPPKNSARDHYNNIIDKYAAKLEKFSLENKPDLIKVVEEEKISKPVRNKPKPIKVVEEEQIAIAKPVMISKEFIVFDKKDESNDYLDSTMQELQVIKKSGSSLENNSMFRKIIINKATLEDKQNQQLKKFSPTNSGQLG